MYEDAETVSNINFYDKNNICEWRDGWHFSTMHVIMNVITEYFEEITSNRHGFGHKFRKKKFNKDFNHVIMSLLFLPQLSLLRNHNNVNNKYLNYQVMPLSWPDLRLSVSSGTLDTSFWGRKYHQFDILRVTMSNWWNEVLIFVITYHVFWRGYFSAFYWSNLGWNNSCGTFPWNTLYATCAYVFKVKKCASILWIERGKNTPETSQCNVGTVPKIKLCSSRAW